MEPLNPGGVLLGFAPLHPPQPRRGFVFSPWVSQGDDAAQFLQNWWHSHSHAAPQIARNAAARVLALMRDEGRIKAQLFSGQHDHRPHLLACVIIRDTRLLIHKTPIPLAYGDRVFFLFFDRSAIVFDVEKGSDQPIKMGTGRFSLTPGFSSDLWFWDMERAASQPHGSSYPWPASWIARHLSSNRMLFGPLARLNAMATELLANPPMGSADRPRMDRMAPWLFARQRPAAASAKEALREACSGLAILLSSALPAGLSAQLTIQGRAVYPDATAGPVAASLTINGQPFHHPGCDALIAAFMAHQQVPLSAQIAFTPAGLPGFPNLPMALHSFALPYTQPGDTGHAHLHRIAAWRAVATQAHTPLPDPSWFPSAS